MNINHCPLLQIQRDLHKKPRNMARFHEYLHTVFGGDVSEENDTPQLVPLIAMNPMGRTMLMTGSPNYWPWMLKQLLLPPWPKHSSGWRPCLRYTKATTNMALGGAWSNRFVLETERFAEMNLDKYKWFSSSLFVSDEPTPERVRQNVLSSIYRTLYLDRHGAPKTLRQMLIQEGQTGRFADIVIQLDTDDLVYSREVLQAYLASDHYPMCIAAMLGDEAARTLGYQPLGLSPYAGIAVVIADFGEP